MQAAHRAALELGQGSLLPVYRIVGWCAPKVNIAAVTLD